MVGISLAHLPPSSTLILLESTWTTESCSGPKGWAGSVGSCRSSTKGARRKERYGVMSDCYDRSQRAHDRTGRCPVSGGVHYLEVTQETHIGIAERDLPLRSCIWDLDQTHD